MLDKSIAYVEMFMRCPKQALQELREPELPKGYRFQLYQPGDMRAWAEIETSVGEFSEIAKAEEYFKRDFLPEEELIRRRMWFILGPDGKYLATTTAWYSRGYREGMIHWVACRPEAQGLGLGRAVVTRALLTLREEEGGAYVSLHTQTWSHVAVGMYLSLGFRLRIDREDEKKQEGFDRVKAVLAPRMRADKYQLLLATAYREGELDALDAVVEKFREDRFATCAAGIAIDAAGDDRARCTMVLAPQHRNAMGAVMGGAIFTLADFAFAVASNSGGMDTVSLDSQIHFLGLTKGMRLLAEAEPVKIGRTTCVYRIEIADELGNAVALVTTTGFRKEKTKG